jgi:hypothetical protein
MSVYRDGDTGLLMASLPFGFEFALTEPRPIELKEVESGVERSLRLHLRVLLAQQDPGARDAIHAVADDLALSILKSFKVEPR